MSKDYYNILGVTKAASAEEIKRAFRKKAHEYHPDKQGGSAEKFKEANQAYQVLSDEQKRKAYDTYGSNWEAVSGGFGGGDPFGGFSGGAGPGSTWDFSGFSQNVGGFDLGDIFGDFFGNGQNRQSRKTHGIDLEMGIEINFEEAVFGVKKEISLEKQDICKICTGTGSREGGKIITCPKCHGQGQIRTTRRTIFGNIASSVGCDRCRGQGKVPEKPCAECGGNGIKRQKKTIEVNIPPGVDDGQRIRVQGEGEAGYRGTSPGDLYLLTRVRPSKEFVRDGFTLYKDMPISFTQATLGVKLIVHTLDGEIELKIPSGTQSGAQFRVRGKGVPHVNNSTRRDDLIITIRVVIPKKLSRKEKELLTELAKEKGETVEIDETLWDSIKESFH